MIQDDINNMLFQAQNMFQINKGMSPMIFMRIKDELVIKDVDMSSLEAVSDSIKKFKSMIESGELEQFVFMKEIYIPDEQWVLTVIKANNKEEKQWVCDVKLEDDEYKFSEWVCYDNSDMRARKNTFNNLFGQVFCNYN